MSARSGVVLIAVAVMMSGCGTILGSLGPKGGGGSSSSSGGSREEKVRAQAVAAKDKFLTTQAPDSAASHMNWIKQYEKSRNFCHTWAWKDHGMKDKVEACAKDVNKHYLALAPAAVQMLLDKGKGLQAHWAVRKLGDHSRHRFWNLPSQAPAELAQKAAAARAAETQQIFESSQRYAAPNTAGCVASKNPLPKGNARIAEPVFHVKIGPVLHVRCYMQTRISSMMAGKDSPTLKAEVNTTDQNLSNCKGYSCTKDPDMSYWYDLPVDITKYKNGEYFDFQFNTATSPKGKSVTKDDFGTIEVTGGLFWVVKYEKRWNDKTKAQEVVPIWEQIKGVTSLSYQN